MWWLRLRRLAAWLIAISGSAAYWIVLAPILHTKQQYIDAFIVFVVLFFGTVTASAIVLRLPFPEQKKGVWTPRDPT